MWKRVNRGEGRGDEMLYSCMMFCSAFYTKAWKLVLLVWKVAGSRAKGCAGEMRYESWLVVDRYLSLPTNRSWPVPKEPRTFDIMVLSPYCNLLPEAYSRNVSSMKKVL
jgi:hypothetical protein